MPSTHAQATASPEERRLKVFTGGDTASALWGSSASGKVPHTGCAREPKACLLCPLPGASPVAQLVNNLPAMWETSVQSLGWEDPLEKGKATPVKRGYPV